MEEIGHDNETHIWRTLFAVSSLLYRIADRAPRADALRWHLQDIAVRLLREVSVSAALSTVVAPQRPRYTQQRALQELQAVEALLSERPWVVEEDVRAIINHRVCLEELLMSSQQFSNDSHKEFVPKPSQYSSKALQQKDIPHSDSSLTDRQERIIDALGRHDQEQVSSSFFSRLFPSVSGRTVRRDLKVLVEEGLLVQQGSGRSVRYRLS